MRRTVTTLMACLALGGLAAGCGGDDGGTVDEGRDQAAGGAATTGGADAPGAAAPAEGERAVIRMKGIKFDPDTATVNVGQEVVWPNDDPVPHNVVANEGADFRSDDYGKGEEFKFTPEKPGDIKYECTLHPGMEGTLKVVE